jgi:hypothetical protein
VEELRKRRIVLPPLAVIERAHFTIIFGCLSIIPL